MPHPACGRTCAQLHKIFADHLKIDLDNFDAYFNIIDRRPDELCQQSFFAQDDAEHQSSHDVGGTFCISLVERFGKREPRGIVVYPNQMTNITAATVVRLSGSLQCPQDSSAETYSPMEYSQESFSSMEVTTEIREEPRPYPTPSVDFTEIYILLLQWKSSAGDFFVGVCSHGRAKGRPAFLYLDPEEPSKYFLIAKRFEDEMVTYDTVHDDIEFSDRLKVFNGRNGEFVLRSFLREYGKSLVQDSRQPHFRMADVRTDTIADINILSEDDMGSEESWVAVEACGNERRDR